MTQLTRWEARPLAFQAIDSPFDYLQPTIVSGKNTFRSQRTLLFNVFRRNRELTRALAASGCDVVHAHFGPDAMAIAPTAARANLPLVATFHGFDATALASLGHLYRLRLRSLFHSATVLIAVSSFIAERLIALGAAPEKVHVHHIGVRPQAATARRNAEGPILFVGRLTEKKGVADLLAAMTRVAPELRGREIRIIGDGELRAELEARAVDARLNVRFLGMRSSSDVLENMLNASMLVAPSRTSRSGDSEGLPTTVQEAGAVGLPVLSTKHAGIPDVVIHDRTGLLVEEGDVDGLAAGIARLLENPTQAWALGDRARELVTEGFNLERQNLKLEELYDLAMRRGLKHRGLSQPA